MLAGYALLECNEELFLDLRCHLLPEYTPRQSTYAAKIGALLHLLLD